MTRAAPFRVGKWLPSDQQVLERWLDDLIAKADARGDVPLLPVVEEFRQLIERDPEICMLFALMLTQTPRKPTSAGKPQVRTVDHMLKLFNHILTHAPEYDDTGLVGFPVNATWAGQFAGGTIYQAFLSALSYHRWHSPVDGRVVKASVHDGTYYSETPAEGYDPAGPNESQGYITEVATRAMIFIEADNPAIGLMCVLPVGMSEVSTCEITVYQGQHVKKGDQLGMFHFGGSTHCLMFRSAVRLDFDFRGQTPGLTSSNIPVNARIATVARTSEPHPGAP